MDEETGYCSCFTTTAAGAALQQQLQHFVLADVATEAIVVKQQKELKKLLIRAQTRKARLRTFGLSTSCSFVFCLQLLQLKRVTVVFI